MTAGSRKDQGGPKAAQPSRPTMEQAPREPRPGPLYSILARNLPIQRKEGAPPSGGPSGGAAGAPSGGAGNPLPEATRTKMEQSFGARFDAVRVHEGAHVGRLGALAFT